MLKMFSGCLNVILPVFLVYFYHFFQTQKNIFVQLNISSPLLGFNLIHSGNWTTSLMPCPGLHTVWFPTGIMVIKEMNICVFPHVIWGYILQFLWWQRQMPPIQLPVIPTILTMEMFEDQSSMWDLRHDWFMYFFLTWHCSSDFEHNFISSFKDLTGTALTMAVTNNKMRGGSYHVNRVDGWIVINDPRVERGLQEAGQFYGSSVKKHSAFSWLLLWNCGEKIQFLILHCKNFCSSFGVFKMQL